MFGPLLCAVMDKKDDDSGSGGDEAAKKLLEQAQRMVARQGSGEAAVVQLLTENKEYRDQIRDLRAKVPGEGAVVLSKADAAEWESFKKLGKAEEVAKLVKEHPVLVEFKTSRERTDTVREAARLAGYEPDVLVDIVAARNLSVEVKTEKVKQKNEKGEEITATVMVPYVKPSSSADAVPLTDYAKAHLTSYEPVLKAKGAGGEDKSNGTSRVFPRQTGSQDDKASKGAVDDFIKKREEASQRVQNPLAPKAAATT